MGVDLMNSARSIVLGDVQEEQEARAVCTEDVHAFDSLGVNRQRYGAHIVEIGADLIHENLRGASALERIACHVHRKLGQSLV